MHRPSWTGPKPHQARILTMVQSNRDQAPNIVIKKMAKVDPNAVSTYKKVYSMGKVVEPHHGSKNMLSSAAQVTSEHLSASASVGDVVSEKVPTEAPTPASLHTKALASDSAVDSPTKETSNHANNADQSTVLGDSVAATATAPKSAAVKRVAPTERAIEPWTWNMVRNMDDNDLQATSIDAVGVTLRSVALTCLG